MRLRSPRLENSSKRIEESRRYELVCRKKETFSKYARENVT